MLDVIFGWMLLIGIFGLVLFIIIDSHCWGKVTDFVESGWGNFIAICLILSFAIGLLGSIICPAVKQEFQSLDSYYNHLKVKQRIETSLKMYEIEIENVKYGFTDLIRFDLEEDIKKLNNDINNYNGTINRHKQNSKNWLLSDFSNKNIRNMELFEPIF